MQRMTPFASLVPYAAFRMVNWGKLQKPRPVFIVGCGHSGTTLLKTILGAHPNIYSYPHESAMMYEGPNHAKRMIRHYQRLAVVQSAKVFIEKTPRHIHFLDELLEVEPNARIIIMIRDGRDVAISYKKRNRGVVKGITRWVEDNRAGQIFWDRENVHVLKYEDLIEDFDSTITAALNFIGEEYHQACKDYHLKQRPKEKPSGQGGEDHQKFRDWQISQPLFDGRGQWKALDGEERRAVKEIAGDMLAEYGYAKDNNW